MKQAPIVFTEETEETERPVFSVPSVSSGKIFFR